jgi:hypothetical protein
VGRTLNAREDDLRPIVALKKITYPDSRQLTKSLIRFDTELHSYNPNSDVINRLLPIIDHEYEKLIEECRRTNIVDALDHFFDATSSIAVVGDGLKAALAVDLEKDIREVEIALIETKWFKSTLQHIKNQFRKSRKNDPVKYAESVRQIVDVFGLRKTIYLLNTNGVNLQRSALTALCRIANETPKIKALIRNEELKLTIAFELPNVEEQKRERIAEQVASFKTYGEQKDFLKKVKECQ